MRANYYWWNYWVHYKSPIRDQALDLYQQAIDLDPKFALAYARKAQLLASYPDYTAAIPLAEKALTLNPNLSEAHLVMGDIDLWGTWNLKQPLDQFIQANTLMPNNAEILTAMGDAYMGLGMWQQAQTMNPGKIAQEAIAKATPYPEGRWLFIPVQSKDDIHDIKKLLDLRIETTV